jgi:hypothetical protein
VEDDYTSHASPEDEDEPWWYVTRRNAWRKLNIAAAWGLAAYVLVRHDPGWYEWATRSGYLFALAVVALVAAIPIRPYVRKQWGRIALVWLTFLTFFVAVAAIRAAADAHQLNHANCWTLRSSGDTSTMACAPGHEPTQGTFYDRWSDSGSSSFCEEMSSGAGGVTIWRCVYQEF